jgi:hypothetical protein
MREPGFEEYAELWQDPGGDEHEAFEALARRARRNGRLMAYGDVTLAILIAALAVIGVFVTPNPATLVAAVLMVGATSWVSLQRRRIRQMAATLVTADRSAFLASSIRNATANLRRVTLTLTCLPFLFASGVMFRLTVKNEGHVDLGIVAAWARSGHGIFGLSVFAILVALTLRSRRRFASELRRLQALQAEYDEEGLREVAKEPTYPR